ncbi:hypothetical protein CPLU01_03590 [Colletotrichum plurivorum]|uniref:DUF7587 domain-containing protein n=1 Tax=Colletotrichum plurivorum TaxID=2175906 RepID=A0A8H6NL24_9PEZI|nr:hypothetical protein CPLU01_03590 [Colletotrichum plurivorum]
METRSKTSSTTTKSNTEVERGGCLPFSPCTHQPHVSPALDEIPRYLYRVHAPSTAGRTTADQVASRAAVLGRPDAEVDILARPARDAAEMLNCHLRGWARDSDNLMSWSSSLLFVLQYALWRTIKIGPDDPSEIRLYVLDTTSLPPRAFVPDSALLDTFGGVDSWKSRSLAGVRRLRRQTPYNFGEYLCQGALSIEGSTASATLQQIIDHGLFRLCPEMGEPNDRMELAKRVVKLRNHCFDVPRTTTKAEVRTAIALAEGCFGDEWALPMMASFLSLCKRLRNDAVIADAFKANFSEKEMQQHELGALKTFPHDRLPEVEQFARIIQDINSDRSTRAVDSVIATTMKLSSMSLLEKAVVHPLKV